MGDYLMCIFLYLILGHVSIFTICLRISAKINTLDKIWVLLLLIRISFLNHPMPHSNNLRNVYMIIWRVYTIEGSSCTWDVFDLRLLYWHVSIINIHSLICNIVDIIQLCNFNYNIKIFLYTQVELIYGYVLFYFKYLRLKHLHVSLALHLSEAEIRYLPSSFHSNFTIRILFHYH